MNNKSAKSCPRIIDVPPTPGWENGEIHRFRDFNGNYNIGGDKIKIDDLLDREIIVIGYKIGPSKYNTSEECLQLQYTLDERHRTTFTGSEVLISQILDDNTKLPFYTTIIKKGKSYSFS